MVEESSEVNSDGIVLKQYDGSGVTDDDAHADFLIGQSGIVEDAVTHLALTAAVASDGVLSRGVSSVMADLYFAGFRQRHKRGRLVEIDIDTSVAIKTMRDTTLPALVQEDINRDGTVFQYPCRV